MKRVLARFQAGPLLLGWLLSIVAAEGCRPGPPTRVAAIPLDSLASQVAVAAARHPIVVLGESSHGVEEFGRFKLAVVQALHARGHAKLILLESPFLAFYGTSLDDTSLTASAYVESTTYAVWHSSAYRDLVTYIRQRAAAGDTIRFVGIDPVMLDAQRGRAPSRILGAVLEVATDSSHVLRKLGAILDQLQRLERSAPLTRTGDRMRALDWLSKGKALVRSRVGSSQSDSLRTGLATARALLDCFQLWVDALDDMSASRDLILRDKQMGRLAALVRDDLYPNQSTVILTHNWHARRRADLVAADSIPEEHSKAAMLYPRRGVDPESFVSLGGVLTGRYPDRVFVVGLYFGEGTIARNDRVTVAIGGASRSSIEQRILKRNPGGGVAIFNTRQNGLNAAWWNMEQHSRYSGLWYERFVPAQQYDCVVVLPRATPPVYTDRERYAFRAHEARAGRSQ